MRTQKICSFFLGCYFLAACFFGEAQAKLTIDLTQPTKSVSPKLYGLMTEEINYSYDGGLYAELIRNRIFRDNPRAPDHWSLLQEGDAKGKISLDNKEPINEALTVSLKLDIDNSGKRNSSSCDSPLIVTSFDVISLPDMSNN